MDSHHLLLIGTSALDLFVDVEQLGLIPGLSLELCHGNTCTTLSNVSAADAVLGLCPGY